MTPPGSRTRSAHRPGEPNIFGVDAPFTITATTESGSTITLTELVYGLQGADGFAFLADPGDSLVSITITNPEYSAGGFAVGEFGIALVPAPPALALLGVMCLGRRRRP